MIIQEIYKKFNIPPNLQQHMLRVAAYAKLIINNFNNSNLISSHIILNSCLLHDLGNIIKFDFDNFSELLGAEEKNIEYWKKVKTAMIYKYGNDEDIATVEMVNGLNVSPEVLFIVKNWGFKNFKRIAESDNWNWKIAVYSDHRISPIGVVTLQQNLENKQKRYKLSKQNASHLSEQANELFNSATQIEQEIMKNSLINLHTIDTIRVDNLTKELLNQPI